MAAAAEAAAADPVPSAPSVSVIQLLIRAALLRRSVEESGRGQQRGATEARSMHTLGAGGEARCREQRQSRAEKRCAPPMDRCDASCCAGRSA